MCGRSVAPEESFNGTGSITNLVIIAVLPLAGEFGPLGQSAKLDIEHAVHEVNSNNSILRRHELTIQWVDSRVRTFDIIINLFAGLHL